MKIRLELDGKIFALSGREAKDQDDNTINMAESAGNIILTIDKWSHIKRIDMATLVYRDKVIDVDTEEYDILYATFEKSKTTSLIIAPILKKMKACKEISEKNDKK